MYKPHLLLRTPPSATVLDSIFHLPLSSEPGSLANMTQRLLEISPGSRILKELLEKVFRDPKERALKGLFTTAFARLSGKLIPTQSNPVTNSWYEQDGAARLELSLLAEHLRLASSCLLPS